VKNVSLLTYFLHYLCRIIINCNRPKYLVKNNFGKLKLNILLIRCVRYISSEQHYRKIGFDVTQERGSTVTMETGGYDVTGVLYSPKLIIDYQADYDIIQ
jgi:hypothetical protein